MGKFDEQQLPVQQQQEEQRRRGEAVGWGVSKILGRFSFKCVVVLLMSVAVFVPALFWVIHPSRSDKSFGYDARDSIKLSASVQSYFRLQKPASELISQIGRLEYDINEEIGVPYMKVAVLSIHPAGVSNWTDVVFGFLADPLNTSAVPAARSVLKLTLIELFLGDANLTLTNSTFGQPYSFEILRFPGGITVIPKPPRPIWQIPQILFHFTLNNSVSEINEYSVDLREQLKLGLHLMQHENVYVQVTNKNGSTRDPPVTVDASITSDYGNLSPQRLNQLAQMITGSPSKNLGLNNTVFGKVKEVRLSSSYLNHSTQAAPPSPSPAPSPVQSIPIPSPSPSPSFRPPCVNYDISCTQPPYPESQPPISNSQAPQLLPSASPSQQAPDFPPQPSNHPPSNTPTSQTSSAPSPSPATTHGSRRNLEKCYGAHPPVSPLSSFAAEPFCNRTRWLSLFILLMVHILFSRY